MEIKLIIYFCVDDDLIMHYLTIKSYYSKYLNDIITHSMTIMVD